MHKVITTRNSCIEPYFFGPPERRLFGIVTKPREASESVANLLVCYPIGHEYLNAHRSLAHLAVKLAEGGVTTLRFDYAGTGDSFDSEHPAGLDQLTADVATAAAEPRLHHGPAPFGLLGARLGAVAALRHAARGEAADFLILWDPVIQGRAYVEELHDQQQSQFLAPLMPRDAFEVNGFRYAQGLLDELAGFDMLRSARRPAKRILIVTARPERCNEDLRAHFTGLGADVTVVEVDGAPLGWPPVGRVKQRGITEIRTWMRRLG